MPILPVAEYMPDQPDLAEATIYASNVIPLTPQSYGPLPTPMQFSSNALDDCPLGMGYGEDTNLTHHIFAGTGTKLWAINGTSTTWTDVSGSAYTTDGDENWHFAQFKNLMLATDFEDPIQSWDMRGGSGTKFATLAAGAPKARYIAVAKDFAIVANTNDPVGGANPQRVWWSAVGDPTNWPTPGTTTAQQVQSDYNDMVGPMGPITGLAPNLAGCDCAVFFERGVFRMIYAGPPDIFYFYPAATVRGAIAPNAIVPLGALVYYLGEDGFYVFDGNQSVPIGANKVDRTFFSSVDPTKYNLVVGAADIATKSIFWIYRSLFSTTPYPDRVLIFRWDIQRWSFGRLSIMWIARVPVSQTGTVPMSQGQLQLAIVNPAYQLAYFSGTPLPAQIGTKVVQLNPPRRSFVSGTRPLVQANTSFSWLLTEDGRVLDTEGGVPIRLEYGGSAGTLTVALSARNTYYDAEIFGPEVIPDISGQCSIRSEGRYHRARLTMPAAGGPWTNFAGIDVTDVIPSGTR